MLNTVNVKKRLVFPAVAVPLSFIIINSQISITAQLARLMGGCVSFLSGADVYPGQVLAMIIVAFGTYEYTKMLSALYRVNAFWLGYIWILLMCCVYLFNISVPATLSNSALLMLVAFEAFFFGRGETAGRWKRVSLFFIGMMFMNIAAIGIMALWREPVSALFSPPNIPAMGRLDVVFMITAVFMTDTAAYFAGSAWGKRKLTSISPKKTVEGSVAGLLTAVAVMTVGWAIAGNHAEYPFILGPILGVIIGVTAQAGDLFMSLVKRYFRVKDSSDIIPGHGGVLDRFDSLFFAVLALYLFAWLMTR